MKLYKLLICVAMGYMGTMEVFAACDTYCSILFSAVRRGDVEEARVFIYVKGVNVNTQDVMGRTPLHNAVINNDIQMVDMLIAERAAVNILDQYHNTALMYAIERSNVNMVRKLVAAKADVNTTGTNGNTALTYAKNVGNQEIVKILKDAGAKA